MAVNNKDILLIQQLLQNELDELSSVELRARISDSISSQDTSLTTAASRLPN